MQHRALADLNNNPLREDDRERERHSDTHRHRDREMCRLNTRAGCQPTAANTDPCGCYEVAVLILLWRWLCACECARVRALVVEFVTRAAVGEYTDKNIPVWWCRCTHGRVQ